MRRRHVLLAVALLGLASVTAAGAMTPRQLYGKLLTTGYSPLPKGYYEAKVGSSALDKRMKRHHAVGVVQVTLSGDAAIYYYVFPSRADALAFNRDRNYDSDGDVKRIRTEGMGKVPGFTLPSVWRNLTIEGENAFGKKVRNGVTIMGVVKRNVLVGAATISTDNEDSGDVPTTIRLLGSALKHLAKVQRQKNMV